jgi:hypothetical protein
MGKSKKEEKQIKGLANQPLQVTSLAAVSPFFLPVSRIAAIISCRLVSWISSVSVVPKVKNSYGKCLVLHLRHCRL